ncbi:MAG: GNAT family protein, partial [Candidatus Nanopelagicales bacterium]
DEQIPDVATEWDAWPEDLLPGTGDPTLCRLTVEYDGVVVGTMSWHATDYGPTYGSRAWNIGVALAPEHRGRGIGSAAQRILAEYLLRFAERVEASTDVSNIAEQRALESAGFTREGILRAAQHRADGTHHDLVLYSLVTTDLADGA